MPESDGSSVVELIESPTKAWQLDGAVNYPTKFNPTWRKK